MNITCPHCARLTSTPVDILATRAACDYCGKLFSLDALPTMVPTAAATSAELLAGQRLGGCRLVRVIGRGGMGEVYEAVQESLGRKVAVKVLPPSLAKDEAFIKRFNREAGALAQLSHPHIVAIYDRGCEDGHYYFVLEHVEGPAGGVAETLHSRLRNGPGLTPSDCARLMVQVAEALAYAHGKGVIHRDIKPSNILLDARSNARLVDFGIARLIDAGPVEDHQLTLTGEVLGTTGYLAPEQREGRKDVDGRADIYSCGVVLYQMLTGRMPEGVFELPSEVVADLPTSWDVAVGMALHRNPDRRCQTMDAFLVALRAVASGQSLSALPRPTDRPVPVGDVRGPDTPLQRTPVVGKCAKCGSLNPGDNIFCIECGVNLYEGCPACKAENRVGVKFCGKCGVDLIRLHRQATQRRHALDLGSRAGQLPPASAAPLWREAAGVWSALLVETPNDNDGQAAHKEAQAQLCSALFEEAKELTTQATTQSPATAGSLLREADAILVSLLAEFPGYEPAQIARGEVRQQISARKLEEAQALIAIAAAQSPAAAVRFLREADAILVSLLAEFPDYEPAQIARGEVRQQISARKLEEAQELIAKAAGRSPATAVSLLRDDNPIATAVYLLRDADVILVSLLAEFPSYEPAQIARGEVHRQISDRKLAAEVKLAATKRRRTLTAIAVISLVVAVGIAFGFWRQEQNKIAFEKAAVEAKALAEKEAAEAKVIAEAKALAVKQAAEAKVIAEAKALAEKQAAEAKVIAEAKALAEKRLEWTGKAMQRAGMKAETVKRTLTQGGTVVAWGSDDRGQTTVPAGLSGVVAIAAGRHHTVALKQDGTVVAWGSNKDFDGKIVGQSIAPAGLSGVVAIAAGERYTVALKQDGTVVTWGDNSYGRIKVPAGLSGVVAITAGSYQTFALKQDGTVVQWGSDGSGQPTVPAGLSGVVAIAAGWWHTVALKQDGTVVAWGSNSAGQTKVPARLSGVVAIAGGGWHTVALKQDGTVVAWEYNEYGQTKVPAGLSGVVAIAAGGYHTVALKLPE